MLASGGRDNEVLLVRAAAGEVSSIPHMSSALMEATPMIRMAQKRETSMERRPAESTELLRKVSMTIVPLLFLTLVLV